MNVLTIQNLIKSFGSKKVLCGLELSVQEHSIFGFIGKNGAGKTTTMKAILGLTKCDSGAIYVMGEKVHFGQTNTNRYIGYLPDVPEFYSYMTATEYLTLCGNLCGMDKADITARSTELLKLVGLGQEKRRIKGFSRGMKQRLGIAQALLNDPRILILDEPTAGLDPKERVRFRNLISSLAENRIVILSTHIVSDVEYIANEILIMKNGELIQHGSPEEILKPIEKCVWECDVSRKEAEELELNYVTANLKHNNGAERLRIISQEAPCRTAWNVDPTLEDLYLYYFAEVSDNE